MDINEKKAENTPAGGVLVGKKDGQTIIHDEGTMSGYLVGKLHKDGGIKAVNKATGQPLEMQGGEVVITAPAVSDQTKREFEGKMMTNREILSAINQKGGGVSFAEGGEVPERFTPSGASYNYGGKTMTDHEILKAMNGSGHLSKGKSLKQIAQMHNVSLAHINEQLAKGLEVEKEHFADFKERTRVAKDHLVENPNYYTILEKAGLKDGGHLNLHDKHRENLVKDAKDGNTPARDLNNYNDLMDVQADGEVGGDSGIFADGGNINNADLSELLEMAKSGNYADGGLTPYNANQEGDYFPVLSTGGGVEPIKVEKIIISQDLRRDKGYSRFVKKEFSDFQSFKNALKELVEEEDEKIPNAVNNGGFLIRINQDSGDSPYFWFEFNNKQKNTVSKFNPSTGKVSDFEKQLKKKRPKVFNSLDWSEFFEGNKQTKKDNSVIRIVITYDSRVGTKYGIALKNSTLELYEYLKGLRIGSFENVKIQPIGNALGVNPIPLDLNTSIWENILTKMPEESALKEINRFLYSFYSNLDFDAFATKTSNGSSSTAQTPTLTSSKELDLRDTKVWIGDDERLSKAIQEAVFTLGWTWSGDKTVKYTDSEYLVFNSMKFIGIRKDGRKGFDANISKEINPQDILLAKKPVITTSSTQQKPTSTSGKEIDLRNTKIWIGNDRNLSLRVQNKAFELGWGWGSTIDKTVQSTGASSLFFYDNNQIEEYYTKPSFDSATGFKQISVDELFGIPTPVSNTTTDKEVTSINMSYKVNGNPTYYSGLSTGKGFIEAINSIENSNINNDVKVNVSVQYKIKDNNGNLSSTFETQDEYIDFGKGAFRPSNWSVAEIKSIVANDWFDGKLDFDKFFSDIVSTALASKTPTSIPVVPKTVETSVSDLDEAVQKLEKASSKVALEYNKEIYDQSLKFLYDTKATYELALKFTPESAFMYERLEIMKKLADLEKNIKRIEDMKKGGAFYILAKILEKLQRGENWRTSENAQDVITNQLPQSEIDVIIRSHKFKNWFGNWEKALVNDEYDNVSKALTDGIPSVYHHGARRIKYTYREVSNGVLYLAENISYALWFSQNSTAQAEEGNYLTDCFVNIKNPIDLTAFHVNQIDLADLVRYVDAIYPLAKIYDFIPAQVALLIKTNQPTNIRMWAWQLIRKYAKFVNHIKENTPYDGFLYYENNPSDQVINPITGQSEENVTKAVAIFKSHQVKVVDAVLFDGGLDDWRFENGGKINN
jgi:hypothetical protein